jgi:putative ABC transport system ATP-binding protein
MLCDEPTGALDIETGKQVLGLLRELNHELGMTVILITHNNAIAGIADRVAVIRDGQIVSIEEQAHPLPVADLDW